jgi:hypothetical protein
MRRILIVAVAVAAAGCTYSMIEHGQLRTGDFRRVLARTAAVRGLPLPAEIVPRVIQRDDVPRLLEEIFYDDWNEAELRRAEETMTTIGLWPDGVDLLRESIGVQGDEVAGFYSPARRTLYVVEGVELPSLLAASSAATGRDFYTEFVLSHEIVHALQHAAFPSLFHITSTWKEQDDVVLALHAALEGDAIRYGFEVISPDGVLPPAERFLELQEQYLKDEALARAPALLRYSLLFPYVHGYPLSLEEGKHLLRQPPISTEQAMHASKRKEPFSLLDLSEAVAALPRGCRLVGQNTMGELLISILFRGFDSTVDAAAWSGWDGDRYLVARCGERRELLWSTSWDSETDAREFAAAYGSIASQVSARAGLAEPPRVDVQGKEVCVYTDGLASLAQQIGAHVRRRRAATLADLRP